MIAIFKVDDLKETFQALIFLQNMLEGSNCKGLPET